MKKGIEKDYKYQLIEATSEKLGEENKILGACCTFSESKLIGSYLNYEIFSHVAQVYNCNAK